MIVSPIAQPMDDLGSKEIIILIAVQKKKIYIYDFITRFHCRVIISARIEAGALSKVVLARA